MRRIVVEREPFDDNLPLCALGEDIEAGLKFRRPGDVGGPARCVIVHLAARSGRLSEYKVGYSKVAKPIYSYRKSIGYSAIEHAKQLLLSFTANILYMIFSSHDRRVDIDRVGRLKGNLHASRDLLSGKLSPC